MQPENGDGVAYLTAKGVHGGKTVRLGALITWGEKLCVVWGEDQYHGGLDVVPTRDVFADPAEAKRAYEQYWRGI